MWRVASLLFLLSACTYVEAGYRDVGSPYYGRLLGELSMTSHNISGEVWIADYQTIVFTNFFYDGLGPDTFVWIGAAETGVDYTGTLVPIVYGRTDEGTLRAFDGETLVVTLPRGSLPVEEYRWISIWCREFQVDFSNLTIPENVTNPSSADLGGLTGSNGLRADNVRIVDAKTIIIINLSYDRPHADTYFWADGGFPLTENGTKLIWKLGLSNVANEQEISRSFRNETITVYMPDDRIIYDLETIGIYSLELGGSIGQVSYNSELFYVPAVIEPFPSYQNCEVLVNNTFQVQWRVHSDTITVELAGRLKLGDYLAFGLSGSANRTQFSGSDVVVVWIDPSTMNPIAVDYNIQSTAQCTLHNGLGACPDSTGWVGGSSDVSLIGGVFEEGITRITYQRKLYAADSVDKAIPLDSDVFIVWAIGTINGDTGRIGTFDVLPAEDIEINFGQSWSKTCPTLNANPSFRIDVCPCSADQGYTGIMGIIRNDRVVDWFLNNQLITAVNLKMGVTYTFDVYTYLEWEGDESSRPRGDYPFYITNNPEGGYALKTSDQQSMAAVYAGPVDSKRCLWNRDNVNLSPGASDTYDEYSNNLRRNCTSSSNTLLTWTSDKNTGSNEIYLQCYTENFFGLKINLSSEPTSSGVTVGIPVIALWVSLLGLAVAL